jgi:hypothetical protein
MRSEKPLRMTKTTLQTRTKARSDVKNILKLV